MMATRRFRKRRNAELLTPRMFVPTPLPDLPRRPGSRRPAVRPDVGVGKHTGRMA